MLHKNPSSSQIFVQLAALFACLCWVGTSRLLACDCPAQTADEQQQAATHIFVGKVTEYTTNWVSGGMKATFVVSACWKNPTEKLMTVTTPFPDQCGQQFEVGQTYLVYTTRKHSYKTNRCMGTQLLQPQTDLTYLGSPLQVGSKQSQQYAWVMLASVLVVVVFMLAVVLRRRRA